MKKKPRRSRKPIPRARSPKEPKLLPIEVLAREIFEKDRTVGILVRR